MVPYTNYPLQGLELEVVDGSPHLHALHTASVADAADGVDVVAGEQSSALDAGEGLDGRGRLRR